MIKRLTFVIILFITANLYSENIIRKINVLGYGKIDVIPDAIVINTGVDSGNQIINCTYHFPNPDKKLWTRISALSITLK